VDVTGDKLDFMLSAGAKRILAINDADFAFRFTQAGVAGVAVNATVMGPDFGTDFGVSGTVSLAFNTTQDDVLLSVAGRNITVERGPPAGSYVRIDVTDGSVTILGNELKADRFSFTKNGSDIEVAGDKLSFTLLAGTR